MTSDESIVMLGNLTLGTSLLSEDNFDVSRPAERRQSVNRTTRAGFAEASDDRRCLAFGVERHKIRRLRALSTWRHISEYAREASLMFK